MRPQLTLAQQRLVLDHEGLARSLARRHQNWPSADRPSRDDLIGEAMLELCLAARDWDEARSPFRPYLLQRLKYRFEIADRQHTYPAQVAEKAHARIRKVREAVAAGASTPQLAARATGLNVERVKEVWPLLTPGAAPLEDFDNEAGSQPAPDEEAVRNIERAQLRAAVASLPDELRVVIEARLGYLSGAEMVADEIAAALDLPPEVVRSRQVAALVRLRAAMGAVDVTDPSG